MNNIYFKSLDIFIDSGELIGIIGPNGCGKSVFLKMISGRVKTDDIFIDKKNINDYNLEYKKNNIVCVFDDDIYNTSNVSDELKYYLSKLNFDKTIISSKVENFIKYFDLDNISCESFDNLGIESKVFIKILSLLIIEPTLICIDDLLTYLGISKKMKILNFIKERNITLLSVTSNMEELLLFDKVLVMNKGKKEVFGKVDDVLNNELLIKDIGLALPFIYDINSLLKSYELIDKEYLIYKELVNILWK